MSTSTQSAILSWSAALQKRMIIRLRFVLRQGLANLDRTTDCHCYYRIQLTANKSVAKISHAAPGKEQLLDQAFAVCRSPIPSPHLPKSPAAQYPRAPRRDEAEVGLA